MKKIVCITGTRPQLIKHAVLLKELERHFMVTSLYTGQHYDYALHEGLKKELFDEKPFFNLQTRFMQHPAQRLGEMIIEISTFLETTMPDAVLVYGDTDTTLAGALATNKLKLPLIHVEAGERSSNYAMPEEHNRVLTDALAGFLFCSSKHAVKNLAQERSRSTTFYCGDLMKDLLRQTAQLFQTPILGEPYIYCTIHRNYTNQNKDKIEELLQVLAMLPHTIIFPVHPATQATLHAMGVEKNTFSNIQFQQPVGYADSIHCQKFAEAVITDSGGIQKEAYWLKRRCITVRRETEWQDTLSGNWNQVVYDDLLKIPELLQTPLGAHDEGLYGTGNAAACVTKHLLHLLN